MRSHRSLIVLPLLLGVTTALLAQNQTPPVTIDPEALRRFNTTPPADNERGLRELSPEEIPPNLNFYAVDPFYNPDAVLGWAETRIDETLDRGVIAMPVEGNRVYLGWRLLKDDPANVGFNVYRATAGGQGVKLNAQPITATTDFVDTGAPLNRPNSWYVRAVVNGVEQPVSVRATLEPNAPAQGYKAIKLRDDVNSISMVGIGDLNGDGTYDFVVKQPGGGKDPGRISVSRGTYKLDAYNGRTGEFMWRVDLGWNLDMGVWWTPFVVRDLDGDNKAEVMMRTAPYAATLEEASPGARAGNALDVPDYLTVFNGETGEVVDQVNWIELQSVQHWGDNTGNRASRHLMAVAHLDGKTPAVLAARGTYGVQKIDAYVLKNRKLEKVWRWSNERAPFVYHGQGQHSIRVGDIDGDGMDEIVNGSLAIDNDGKTMWSSGLGHGDRFYLTDIDPSRPGLEIAYIIEEPHPQLGFNVRDARNGNLLFGSREPNADNALGAVMVGDIDPRHPGMEVWTGTGIEQRYFTSKGEPISGEVPSTSDLVWWDADLLREQVANVGGGGRGGPRGGPPAPGAPPPPNPGRVIGKWQGEVVTRGIMGGSYQVADILGDWREEIVTFYEGELRIYSTTIPAADRRVSLMQDPLYRNYVTERTMGYPHVPQLSYYLGQ